MAIAKGSSGVVKIALHDNSVAAVGQIRSFSIDETADTLDVTVMGATAKSYLGSLTDGTLSVDALWDTENAPQLVFDVGANIDFEIHPEGVGTGKMYTGEAFVTAKTVSGSYDGLVEASFSAQVSGGVTEADSA